MSQNITLGTATAAGGASGAAVVVLDWLLTTAHLQMPPDVAAALMVLLAPVLHVSGMLIAGWLAKRSMEVPTPATATPTSTQ